MYLGRYQVGQIVPLRVWCRDSNRIPVSPDEAPLAIVTSSTTTVLSMRIPARDRAAVTGYFEYPLHLDSRFSVGRYTVTYQWADGGSNFGDLDSFEVVSGGDSDGAVVAMHYYSRPDADYVVQQLDSRQIVKGRNPRT